MKKIMFVCTGNTCRSAMANAYMQHIVNQNKNKDNYLISSCGIYAQTGSNATLNSINAMKKYNVNMNNHRATNIDDINIVDYDFIFCMTNIQKEVIIKLYPSIANKTYTLKEFTNNNKDIDIQDPYGLSINEYEKTAEEITSCIDKLIKLI